jgi:hypothetical protein
MGIFDLFSTSFLFSIAIIIILIGGIFAYVSYRMSEQDHKLTSMVNLVSILAQDLRFVKSKLVSLEDTNNSNNSNNSNNIQYSSEMMAGQAPDLISVSDGGEDEYEDEDEDENEENNENDDDDSTYVSDNDDDDDDDEEQLEDSKEQIKLLNLSLANEHIDNDSPIEDLIGDFEEEDSHHKEDIKTIHLETPINFEETEIPMPLESDQTDLKISGDDLFNLTNGSFDLKNVTISDLGEGEDVHSSKSEYKKMSLNKLREVVVSKGVIGDASKLKKNDILKLLGDE